MNNKVLFVIAFILGFLGYTLYLQTQNDEPEPTLPVVTSFEECANAGYLIRETWPAQCQDSEGNLFAQDIGNELEKLDLIRILNPRPLQQVEFPIEVIGEARGTWFFEANFPIRLYDANDNLIAEGYATALSDWMTEDFVAFESTLNLMEGLAQPETETGTLVLEKSNPSGLEEHADELRVPIKF